MLTFVPVFLGSFTKLLWTILNVSFNAVLKSKENDPNRLFLNRGGALLKEMKTRNTVQKGLPKVNKI
jgi:hypothetical protein